MSIKKDIWDILRTDMAIQKDLDRGLINTRALARYILKNYPVKAGFDTAIVAIREFRSEQVFQKEEQKLSRLFKDSAIKTRDNVACITLRRSGLEKVNRAFDRNDVLRMVSGSSSIKIITDRDTLGEARAIFPAKDVIKVEEGLSELSVTLSEKVIKTKGILARIADEIALQNINIEELIICPPEFLIYVKQEDVIKTYEALLKLRKKAETA